MAFQWLYIHSITLIQYVTQNRKWSSMTSGTADHPERPMREQQPIISYNFYSNIM